LTKRRDQNLKRKKREIVIVEKLKIQTEIVMDHIVTKGNYITRILALTCIVVALISCNNSIVFEEYKNFENQKWNSDSIVFFDYSISDTISKNIIKIKLRHTTDYEFQNLFLFIHSEVKDTVELILANKEGMWLGKGIGDIREFEFEYNSPKLFSQKGDYSFKIEQAMRYGSHEKIQALKNVLSLGVSIKKINE
jgi:gliding motility-associated lipoprotein GldH